MVKEALEKQVLQGTGGMTMKHRLANFLIKYRSTPHSVTGRTLAELMVKRQLQTRLTLLKPNLAQVVEIKRMKQKLYHDMNFKVCRGLLVFKTRKVVLHKLMRRVVKVELCHQCRVTTTPCQSLVHLLLKKPKLKASRK